MPDIKSEKNGYFPRHIAIIMDGNGRWAKQKGLNRSQGHNAGVNATKSIIEYAHKIGIEVLSLYAFSTENWKRPKEEVNYLMNLLSSYLDNLIKNFKNNEFYKDSKINFLGELSVFSADIIKKIKKIEELSQNRSIIKTTVNIAINYGGRDEIVHSVNSFIKNNPNKMITQKDIDDNLYFAGQPEPDLIIRTGGEYRISNFLLWESAYSEFYSVDIYWPDFTTLQFDLALKDYSKRSRRYGGI